MKSAAFAVAAAAIATGVSAGQGHHARRHAHDAFHQQMPRELASGYLATGTSPPAEATCGSTTIWVTATATSPPAEATCGSTTIWVTVTAGEGTPYSPPAPTATLSSIALAPPPSALANSSTSVPITSSSSSSSYTPKLVISPSSNSSTAARTTSSIPSSTVTIVSSTSTIANVPTPLATTCPTPGVYTIPATTVTLTSSTTVCAAASATVTPGTNTIGGVTTIVTTATTFVCPYATISTNSGVVTSTILTTTYVCPSAGTYTIAPITTSVSAGSICVFPTPASYAPGTYTQPLIVTTITATDIVVFCPFTSSAPALSTSSVAAPSAITSSVAPPPATTSSVYVSPSATTSSVYVAPSTTKPSVYVALSATTSSVFFSPSSSSSTSLVQSSAAASSSAPKSSSSGSSIGISIGSSDDKWAITYTPYSSSGGGCLGEAQVALDIASIKAAGFKAVRLYSTDCSTLDFVGKAAKLAGLKMILGVFISTTGISAAQEQVNDIVSWAQWDLVELVVIGNEAIFNKYCTAQELADFITSSKSKFSGAGYTGQCTTTEPLNVLQENGVADLLCPVIDVTGANIHPFFNADITSDQAGSFVSSQLQIVDNLCAGKSGINLECGWPSSGKCNGQACPGDDHQSTAISAITKVAGGKTALFSFTNDLWKQPGDLDCEQFWGSIHLFAN